MAPTRSVRSPRSALRRLRTRRRHEEASQKQTVPSGSPAFVRVRPICASGGREIAHPRESFVAGKRRTDESVRQGACDPGGIVLFCPILRRTNASIPGRCLENPSQSCKICRIYLGKFITWVDFRTCRGLQVSSYCCGAVLQIRLRSRRPSWAFPP